MVFQIPLCLVHVATWGGCNDVPDQLLTLFKKTSNMKKCSLSNAWIIFRFDISTYIFLLEQVRDITYEENGGLRFWERLLWEGRI